MEMEGRGFSELLRSSTEEILIKSMMDNSIGNAVPNMEILGFKNIMQPFRSDNEELFNSWIANGESPASAITHRTSQASTSISADLALNQRNVELFTKKSNNGHTSHQNFITSDEHLSHPRQYSSRNSGEGGIQASNLYLAKAGLPQSLIGNRSSEQRWKYNAMQDSQLKVDPQASHNMTAHNNIHKFKQDFKNMSNFCNISMPEMPNQAQKFMSPSYSSTPYHPPISTTADTISSAVSMLNGTLETKNSNSCADKEAFQGRSYGFLTSLDVTGSISSIQRIGNPATVSPILFAAQLPASGSFVTIEKSLELSRKGFPTETNHIQMSAISREPSQSDSSTAAPVLSVGFDVCAGTTQSRLTFNPLSNSEKQVGYGSLELESRDNEFNERILENSFKDSRKKERLAWMDSTSSGVSVGKEDSTKKRRVERSRKMAKAKERNSTTSPSSDAQGILKRWENLEKEVRSLKLNLSFMNRKDSEQTKQIEELQKHNEELTKEKERLLKEIKQNFSY